MRSDLLPWYRPSYCFEQFAGAAAKNSFHGSMNAQAQFREALSVEDVRHDRLIVEPLTRSMCSPIGDGAAAVVVVSELARLALALIGVALAPLVLPILPPRATARYASVAGMVPQIERGAGKRSPLPQWLAERLEWHELYRIVAEVVDSLEPAMRDQAIILTSSYGTAAALERLGRSDGLPSVYSSHNNYVLWGPPADPVELAIVVGFRQEGSDPPQPHSTLRRLFDEIELVRVYDCDWCPSWRDDTPIRLASAPRGPFREVWHDLRSFH